MPLNLLKRIIYNYNKWIEFFFKDKIYNKIIAEPLMGIMQS